MDHIIAILFGIVQGITEFFPVSSSGHLVLLHDLIGISVKNDLAFDVALHWGTLVALIIFFWKDIVQLARGFFTSLRHAARDWSLHEKLAWRILVGTIPAVVFGLLLQKFDVEETLRTPWVVATLLFVIALLFLFVERRYRGTKTLSEISYRMALLIGTAQAFALIPGVSRSGITIIIAMAFGFVRGDAARFSFLLSIPAVFGAGALLLPNLAGLSGQDQGIVGVGFLAATATGVFALRFLLAFLRSGTMRPFAWYRIVLAIALIGVALFMR
ncbi:MAG: undecaprenyl-diphosphatase UppP [Patescibacteria group bacterium]|jgi:undecaprenyl-diphosphatase